MRPSTLNPQPSTPKWDFVVALCLLPVACAWLVGVALWNAHHLVFGLLCFLYVALIIAAMLSQAESLQFFPRFSGFVFFLALILGDLLNLGRDAVPSVPI